MNKDEQEMTKMYNVENLIFRKRKDRVLLLNPASGRWYVGKDDNKVFEQLIVTGKVDTNNPLHKQLLNDGIISNVSNSDTSSYYEEIFGEDKMHLLILDTTSKCNLACKYCFANATGEGTYMVLGTALKALQKVLEYEKCADVVTIEFSGGEPLLNFELIQSFLPAAREMALQYEKKLSFTIQTNGTLLTDEIIDFLMINGIHIGISLDGGGEVHDINRVFPDGSGTLKKILDNIRKIQNKGSHVSTLAVINTPEQYESIVNFAIENGIESIRTNLVNSIGRAKDKSEYLLQYEELAYKFLEMSKKMIRKEIHVKDATLIYFLWNLLQWKMHMCFRSPCGSGTNQITVSSEGYIYPCQGWKNLGDQPVASVYDESPLSELLSKNIRIQELRNRRTENLDSCKECEWRTFCGVCPREIYGCTGTITEKIGECRFERIVFEELIWEFGENLQLVKEYLME